MDDGNIGDRLDPRSSAASTAAVGSITSVLGCLEGGDIGGRDQAFGDVGDAAAVGAVDEYREGGRLSRNHRLDRRLDREGATALDRDEHVRGGIGRAGERQTGGRVRARSWR